MMGSLNRFLVNLLLQKDVHRYGNNHVLVLQEMDVIVFVILPFMKYLTLYTFASANTTSLKPDVHDELE